MRNAGNRENREVVPTSHGNLLHEDEYDAPSASNMTLDPMSSEDGIQDKFEDGVPENAVHNGDYIEPKGDSLVDVWDDEDSSLSTYSLEKGLEETSLETITLIAPLTTRLAWKTSNYGT
ncbi:hypothetical protein OROMI_001816 [Orobanche minor]